MELLVISIAVFLNFMLLKHKLEKKRYADFVLDILVLAALSFLFGGTMGGMVIAMCAGALMSIYLYFWPPQFLKDLNI